MKLRLVLILFIISNISYGANLDSIFHSDGMKEFCKNSVYEVEPGKWKLSRPLFTEAPDKLYISSKRANAWVVSEVDESGSMRELFKSAEPIYDIEYTEGFLWLAKRGSLLKYDLEEEKFYGPIPTHLESRSLGRHERVHALLAHEGKLFIAHGTLGITSIDLLTHRYLNRAPLLTYQDNGHRSKAMTLAGNNGDLFIGFDNVTEPTNRSRAFNGIVATKFENMKKYHGAAYDHRRSGILAYAWVNFHRDHLVINNLGNLHILNAEKVKRSKKIRPRWKPLRLEVEGEQVTASWIGKVLVQNSTVYGCSEILFPKRMGRVAIDSLKL